MKTQTIYTEVPVSERLPEWLPISAVNNMSTWDLSRCEVLFDNGETRMYWDDWPFAISTNVRLVESKLKH
ncbi:MAG: hypothetical protein V4538_17580 [Bacteroidota bacterium]